jgi:hypothetical protein
VSINMARRFCCDCPICALSLGLRRDRPVIDVRAPPADPAAGRKQRWRMSPVALPQASAGAALFGRAVLGRLDDPSRLVPPTGPPQGGFGSPMSTMRRWGIRSGGSGYFCVTKDSNAARSDRPTSEWSRLPVAAQHPRLTAEQVLLPLAETSPASPCAIDFIWLAGQPGFKSRISYSDAEYFNLSAKETRMQAVTSYCRRSLSPRGAQHPAIRVRGRNVDCILGEVARNLATPAIFCPRTRTGFGFPAGASVFTKLEYHR